MYILYLDGSGSQDWPPPVGNSSSKYYVLAGLAIQDNVWLEAKRELDKIIENYFPDPINRPKELKYSELRGGNKELGCGVYRKLTQVQRQQLTDDAFNLIIKLKPTLFAIVVDKLPHFYQYKMPEHPKKLAVRYMVPRYSKFLSRMKQNGIIVYDAEEARSDLELRQFLHKSRKNGIVLRANPVYDPSAIFIRQNRLEGIIESMFFIDSSESPIIQLVDFCAHAIFLNFERGYSVRYKQIEPLFDRDEKEVFGIKIVPS